VATSEKWTAHWKHLYEEVVTSGLCTGCAGCVVACPYDVLSYDDREGVYKPFHIEEELGPGDCGHGEKGCTYCTRACPRFRAWEPEIDNFLFGRTRQPEEVDGISKDIVLLKAADPEERDAFAGSLSARGFNVVEHEPYKGQLDVTLTKVIDPASGANSYSKPASGMHFVGVKLRVQNEAPSTYQNNANNETTLTLSNGKTVHANYNPIASCGNFDNGQLKVKSGATSTGCVTFQVPKGSKVIQVSYHNTVFPGTTAQWSVP